VRLNAQFNRQLHGSVYSDVRRQISSVPLICLGSVMALLLTLVPVRAQIYSPRRLTQRIAPLLPPAPTNAPRSSVSQTATRPGQAPVDPEQQAADRSEAAAKTDQFRKHRVEEESQSPTNDAQGIKLPALPLVVECTKCQPDSRESLQFVSLSLSNACSLAINRVTMHLVYFADRGEKLKEWTTYRILDQPLPPATTLEVKQPAFFMPWSTKRVKVEVKEIHFSDGTVWAP
jgi:hypothetical protein